MLTDLLLTAESVGTELIELDKQWLLAVNGSDSLYLDRVAHVLTTALTWLPLYLSLFYIVVRNNENFRKVLCVLLAGSVDDLIVKPTVARWRPTHDPEIGLLVDIVDGYRGGNYGFFSAHAANTFSIAIYFCWLIRSRMLSLALIIWSFTNCWTRMYLGVHFPGDILVGLTWGFIVGTSVYFLYRRITRNWRAEGRRYITTEYTDGGFERPTCEIPVAVFYFTVIFALLIATYQ